MTCEQSNYRLSRKRTWEEHTKTIKQLMNHYKMYNFTNVIVSELMETSGL